MSNKTYALIDFILEWKSPVAKHTDTYRELYVDFQLDIFPSDLGDQLAALQVSESYSSKMHAKELIGKGYSSDKVISFDSDIGNRIRPSKEALVILFVVISKTI